MDRSRFDAACLSEKIAAFFAKNPDKKGLRQEYGALSIEDMCQRFQK